MAQTPKDEAQIDAFWGEQRTALSAAGIDRTMYRQYHYWATGQYILGACAPHLQEADILFWKSWWNDTPLQKSDIGRALLLSAASTFDAGARDRLKEPIPRNQCVATTLEWVKEMERVTDGKAKVATTK